MTIYSLVYPISYPKIVSLKFPKVTLRMFLILSALSIIILSVFYIFQVSVEAKERYLLQDYEKKIAELSKENQSLEINLVKVNSLDNVIASINQLNFEKIEKIEHIRVISGQMVSK